MESLAAWNRREKERVLRIEALQSSELRFQSTAKKRICKNCCGSSQRGNVQAAINAVKVRISLIWINLSLDMCCATRFDEMKWTMMPEQRKVILCPKL